MSAAAGGTFRCVEKPRTVPWSSLCHSGARPGHVHHPPVLWLCELSAQRRLVPLCYALLTGLQPRRAGGSRTPAGKSHGDGHGCLQSHARLSNLSLCPSLLLLRQTMMLEKWKVCQETRGESNFLVFSQMLAGVSAEMRYCPVCGGHFRGTVLCSDY